MSICKYVLRIVLRHPIYLAIYVGFLSIMGVFLTSSGTGGAAGDADTGAAYAQARIALIDQDGSAVSKALRAELGRTEELLDVDGVGADAENAAAGSASVASFAIQDALATSQVDAVLVVPDGFGEALLAAARSGDDLPQLEVAYGTDMQAGALAAQRASRWETLVASAAALAPAASADEVLAAAVPVAAEQVDVQTVETRSGVSPASGLASYLGFSVYTVTCSVVVVAGVAFSALTKLGVNRRQLIAPMSTRRRGIRSLLGVGVLVLAVFGWVSVVGITANGAWGLVQTAPVQVVLALLALLCFSFIPFTLAYLLSQLGFAEEGLNAVGNLGGMVLSFLGGVWMPLSMMGEPIRALARFMPVYWVNDAVSTALAASEVDSGVLTEVMLDLGVVLLFAVAIGSVGLVAARMRMTER